MASLRQPATLSVIFLIVLLFADDSAASLPLATGRVMLSSSQANNLPSSNSEVAAADLQEFLSEKGYESVSNSASSELAVVDGAVGDSPSRGGSSTSGSSSSSSSESSSSSSSSAAGAGAIGFNVVLGAPAGGGVGRKMLQTSDDVSFINAFLVALAQALGVPRTALTATSFADQGATFIFDVVVDVSQIPSQTTSDLESRARSIANGSIVVSTAATYSVAASSIVSTPTAVLTVTLFTVDMLGQSLKVNTNSVLSFPDVSRTGTALYYSSASTSTVAPPPQSPTTPPGPVCDWPDAAIIALNPFYSDWASSSAATPCPFTGVTCTAGAVTEIVVDAVANPLDNPSVDLALPQEWSCLTSLENVTVSDANFSGPLPAEWSALTKLTHLDVVASNITGTLPNEWSTLTALEFLNVADNKLSGPFPSQWPHFPSLETLNVAGNELTGTIPGLWYNSVLQSLNLADNKLTGSVPYGFPSILENLNMANNAVEGTLLAFLNYFVSLETLNLENNNFKDYLPEGFYLLDALHTLNLAGNELKGGLPASWAGFSRLKTMNLAENQLSSSLPGDWCQLSGLKTMNLAGNKLISSLHPAWSSLYSLETLNVANNDLTGSIPSGWSNLSSNLEIIAFGNSATFVCAAPAGWDNDDPNVTCAA